MKPDTAGDYEGTADETPADGPKLDKGTQSQVEECQEVKVDGEDIGLPRPRRPGPPPCFPG